MAKAKKKETFGNDKKELSREVTLRFMMLCGEIMMIHRHAGTALKSRAAFCATLNMHNSQFNAYERGQNVTVEHLAMLCKVHNASGTWLLSEKGPRYESGEVGIAVQQLEERMIAVETKLGLNKIPKKDKM